MRKKGSIADFTHQRNTELFLAFRKELQDCAHINLQHIYQSTVNRPCSRFWVSRERAVLVIHALLRHQPILSRMSSAKRDMFIHLFALFKEQRNRCHTMSVPDIVERIIHQPAPRFFLTPLSAKKIITQLRRQAHASHDSTHQ